MILEFIENNPSTILFLCAILLYVMDLADLASLLLIIGVLIQALWWVVKRRTKNV
jgi:threonine/homoserine/homoserine lactone efflux protein